jgi:hypothetical protein
LKRIINNTELNNLIGLRVKLTKLKEEKIKNNFLKHLLVVYDLFDASSNLYEIEIIKLVCSVSEDFIFQKKK